MLENIPFNRALYLKVLVPVTAIVILIFAVAVIGFDYKLTTSDPFGAAASSFLLAYFFHLALWNPSE